MLALKVAAARVDRDADDIRFLAEVCGLGSAGEILDLTEDIIGRHRPLAAKVQFLVEEMFPTVRMHAAGDVVRGRCARDAQERRVHSGGLRGVVIEAASLACRWPPRPPPRAASHRPPQ